MCQSVDTVESYFRIVLPPLHRAALLDPLDPIHNRKEFLTPDGNEARNIFEVNESLRREDWKEWPNHLVAFATNGCGDYFAYDTRTERYRVYYVGPIDSVPEAVAACEEEGFVFSSFDDWYNYSISRKRA